MFGRSLALGLSLGPGGRFLGRRAAQQQCRAASAAAGEGAKASWFQNSVLKSALISGSLSLVGDVLAQALAARPAAGAAAPPGAAPHAYDAARAARMGSFGLAFYGPYQHYWYRALDRALPGRSVPAFLAKVAANQLCLAPVVIAGVFAWNLALQGRAREWPDKARADFVPTLLNGWKFWVPAASVNFVAVPLRHQVLYMSACGVLWTGYLSYQSDQAARPAPPAAAGGKAKGKAR